MDEPGTTTMTYDAVERLTSITYGLTGKKVGYGYNGRDSMTRITDPDGNYISWASNAVGLVTSMTTSISDDSLRRRSSVIYPGTTNDVVTTSTFDNADRIAKIATMNTALTYDHWRCLRRAMRTLSRRGSLTGRGNGVHDGYQ